MRERGRSGLKGEERSEGAARHTRMAGAWREDGQRRGIDKDAYRVSRDAEEESEGTGLAAMKMSFSVLSLFFYLPLMI